jgi:hypothetical protein
MLLASAPGFAQAPGAQSVTVPSFWDPAVHLEKPDLGS